MIIITGMKIFLFIFTFKRERRLKNMSQSAPFPFLPSDLKFALYHKLKELYNAAINIGRMLVWSRLAAGQAVFTTGQTDRPAPLTADSGWRWRLRLIFHSANNCLAPLQPAIQPAIQPAVQSACLGRAVLFAGNCCKITLYTDPAHR